MMRLRKHADDTLAELDSGQMNAGQIDAERMNTFGNAQGPKPRLALPALLATCTLLQSRLPPLQELLRRK
jgi:hypothetical protein